MTPMEDFDITPWVSEMSCRNCLTVVVLSSRSDIMKNISEALRYVHRNSNIKWKLMVLNSFRLKDIARSSNCTRKFAIDFIVIAMDTTRIFCLEWARKSLESVHPDLKTRRVVLVNAAGCPINTMPINPSDITTFCRENRLEILSADVSKQDDAHILARKLLKFIEISIGINTGIPNLNI